MRVNAADNSTFRAIPSVAIRKGIVREILNGKNVDELVGLIREVKPYKFMTMLQEGEKVHWVGLTDKFERTPEFVTYIGTPGKERIFEPIRKEDCGSEVAYRYYKKARDKELLENPHRTVIEDGDKDFITLFKDVAGKKFGEIISTLTENLKKFKQSLSPEERIMDKLNAGFAEYKDIPSRQNVRDMAKSAATDANFWNTPIG